MAIIQPISIMILKQAMIDHCIVWLYDEHNQFFTYKLTTYIRNIITTGLSWFYKKNHKIKGHEAWTVQVHEI